MNKKTQSTSEKFIESLTPKQLKQFSKEYREFALSELILALMLNADKMAIIKLSRIAGVSPTIVQYMHSDTNKDYTMRVFFKTLKRLGCKRFLVESPNGELISLNLNDERIQVQ